MSIPVPSSTVKSLTASRVVWLSCRQDSFDSQLNLSAMAAQKPNKQPHSIVFTGTDASYHHLKLKNTYKQSYEYKRSYMQHISKVLVCDFTNIRMHAWNFSIQKLMVIIKHVCKNYPEVHKEACTRRRCIQMWMLRLHRCAVSMHWPLRAYWLQQQIKKIQ